MVPIHAVPIPQSRTVEAELHAHEFAALLANSLPPQIHGPLYLALCVVYYRLYGSYAICSCAMLFVWHQSGLPVTTSFPLTVVRTLQPILASIFEI